MLKKKLVIKLGGNYKENQFKVSDFVDYFDLVI